MNGIYLRGSMPLKNSLCPGYVKNKGLCHFNLNSSKMNLTCHYGW